MTVASTTSKVSFSGNGSTTAFAVSFYFLANSDLKVTLRKADGTEVVKTLTTDYTVSGAGNTAGGTVTMGTAPASGETLVITRNVALTQPIDYQPNDPFPANTHEQALDRLTMITQQINETLARAIKVSTTNTINSPEFTVDATTRANKVLSFDASGELAVTQELGTYKGNWASGTTYAVRSIIKDTSNANIYICLTAHTASGAQPISTNTDSAKWALLVDAASATSSASSASSSASAASSSATAAATSASNASTSASSASTSASTATTQASNASTSATNAATSATNAASSATAAANSATTAAAAAASGLYRQVLDKSANYTVVAADQGTLFRMNTGSGALTVTLPQISTVTDGFKVSVVKWTGDGNGVTIARSGSDTINGATSSSIGAQYTQITFVADFETSTWLAVSSGLGSTNVVVDVFSGNGSTTAFTLSGDPGSKNNTFVHISGVYQNKSTYSQSGTTITFSTAPPSGTSNIEIVWTQPLSIGVPSDGTINSAKLASGSQLTVPNAVNENANTTLASASTVAIGAATANTINISGTTTITAFDTIAAGAVRRLIFAGALTLTHNATSLILPGGANITTVAGDVAEFVSLGSGNWRCFNYTKSALNAPSVTVYTSGSGTYTTPANAKAIRVQMVGGGGGGGGSGSAGGTGGTGGTTTFGTSLLTCNGGSGGADNSAGGAGGSASIGAGATGLTVIGGDGGGAPAGAANNLAGGIGGSSALGGGGASGGGDNAGSPNGSPAAGKTNTGGGGGGASYAGTFAAAGGGAGGYIDAIISAPSATYSYAVGSGGTAGTAGTGTGARAGGAGGSGVIMVTAYF